MRFISASEAALIDKALMGKCGFSIFQLMELAGFSVAQAVVKLETFRNVLVVAGPGNNGGDALVAARHLHLFGFKTSVFYPKPGLVQQLKTFGIKFLTKEEALKSEADLVIDGIFGFSYSPPIREPFEEIINFLKSKKVFSIDIPSGWNVDDPNGNTAMLTPYALISLTAPKICIQGLPKTTRQFIGGRFIPNSIMEEFELNVPPFVGSEQCVEISVE